VSPEGNESKASKGFAYSLGGFFVWGGDLVTIGDVKRKLTAIFSADVEGYSRLMEEDELATVETLTSHKEIIRKLIRQYRGRVVDSTGDNLLAEFSSVVDAVQCAVEVQQVLSSKNETLPENRRMNFRIGINSGDVIEEGELIYGDGVNVAARVESLAEGGGISISGTAYDQLGKKLPLGYEYLGEQTVKNIEKPVRVYRVLPEAEAAGKVIGEKRPISRQWRWAAIGALAVLIIGAGALAIWNFYFRPAFEPASVEKMAFPLPEKPSIAVLPFVNISEDKGQEYFSDGLTEEIISALSKVPKLFVIARNSTFTYKGKPVKVQQVSEELGVRYVLEGSVRKAKDRVRITAQLIDAITGHHLWSESYDRDLKDIFVLQDEITFKIITALQVKLTEGESARLVAKGTNNLKAYLKALRAREHIGHQTKEGNILARRLAEEAIALDPEFPTPYHLLAATHMMEVWFRTTKSPKQSLKTAVELTQKAIALDDSYADAHGFLGFLYTMLRNHDKAIMEAQKGVALDPNGSRSHYYLGFSLRYAGRFEEAAQAIEKAIRLNPFPPVIYFRSACMAYIGAGRYEEAIAAAKKSVTLSPDDFLGHISLAAAYSLAGQEKEARSTAEEVLRINPKFSLDYQSKILPFKNKTDLEQFIDALRKAGLPETPALPLPDKPSIAVLPFVNMSRDPEQEYFSDGITEEIITALSKTPKLFVIARNSSFTYKGKPVWIPTVGKELGVRYVLEGSVRKAGDKVRVTAQLVDAKTANHLWADRWDRELKDVFAVQDEITLKIITALGVELTSGESARMWAKGTENLGAYLKVLQGREYEDRMTKEDNAKARKMFEEAIALDPEYPVPYSYLGWTHWHDVFLGLSKSPRESMKRAVAAAQKCIALDDYFPPAHGLLSAVYLMQRQHDKAIFEAEKAIALDPNSADDHARLGNVFNFAGKPEEAILALEKAIRLNPFAPTWYFFMLGMAYRETGRYEESIAACKKALKLRPTNLYAHLVLASTYSLLNRQQEAHAAAAEVLRINPKFSLAYLAKSRPHINPANTARFIESLRNAGLPD
jgi:adenylate cyclase